MFSTFQISLLCFQISLFYVSNLICISESIVSVESAFCVHDFVVVFVCLFRWMDGMDKIFTLTHTHTHTSMKIAKHFASITVSSLMYGVSAIMQLFELTLDS